PLHDALPIYLVPFAVDFYVDRIARVSPSRESDSGINSVHLSSFLSNSSTVCQTGLPAVFVVGRVSLADLGFASLGVLADSLLIQLIKLKLTHVLRPLIEVVRNLEGVVTLGSNVRATDTNLHVHLLSSSGSDNPNTILVSEVVEIRPSKIELSHIARHGHIFDNRSQLIVCLKIKLKSVLPKVGIYNPLNHSIPHFIKRNFGLLPNIPEVQRVLPVRHFFLLEKWFSRWVTEIPGSSFESLGAIPEVS